MAAHDHDQSEPHDHVFAHARVELVGIRDP